MGAKIARAKVRLDHVNESKVNAPNSISGDLQRRSFWELKFQFPNPEAPPPNATPRELALYMNRQPTTTVDVLMRTLDPALRELLEIDETYIVTIEKFDREDMN